jgi:nitrite reductase/ring-hydroxylating ferredoxin subunit
MPHDPQFSIERLTLDGVEKVPAEAVSPGLKRGEIFVARHCLQAAGVFDKLYAMILESIEEVAGAQARAAAQTQGLRRLHEIITVPQLLALNPVITKRVRGMAAEVTTAVAEKQLGLGPDVYFEDGPNVRIFCPQDFTVENRAAFEGFRKTVGAGRLTTHGPHQDDRHFHPIGSINIWCAFDRVEVGNGMTVYPDFYGHMLPCITVDGNIQTNQVLGRPITTAMDAGDAWIFETLQVHGSTINQTPDTRFVISFRVVCGTPEFRSKTWYSYVRPSDCSAEGPPDVAIDYSELPSRGPTTVDTSGHLPETVVSVAREDGALDINGGMVPEGEIRPVNASLCVARVEGNPVAFLRGCPHEGADLAGGSVCEGRIVCPWHGLHMNIDDGRSGCRTVGPLKLVPCTEAEGVITIPPMPGRAATGKYPRPPAPPEKKVGIVRRVARRARTLARQALGQ